MPQRHKSSSGLRSSVGGVALPLQWAAVFLAQVPSPPQPPPSLQRSLSFIPNNPPSSPVQNSKWLERCFATSNCTGGDDANSLCGVGYKSPFCGSCVVVQNGTRYHHAIGRCEPCDGSAVLVIIGAAVVLCVLLVLGVAFHRSAHIHRMLRRPDTKFQAGQIGEATMTLDALIDDALQQIIAACSDIAGGVPLFEAAKGLGCSKALLQQLHRLRPLVGA